LYQKEVKGTTMQAKPGLTLRDEEILKAVWYYRYVTAREIASLQFSTTSINHVREIMARLAGNSDLDENNYLCRFTLPAISKKPTEKVFVLGAKGRRILREMGLPITPYFRPVRLKFLSYSYVLHNLILTRTMVAAHEWAKHHQSFSLIDKRISYELPGKIIPDAWLMFEEKTEDGIYEQPIMFEIDRGMELKPKFRAHVGGRLQYLRSGEYKKAFKTDVATIAYATTGQTPEYREKRRKDMCSWIMELLKERKLENWAGNFRVASIEFGKLYDNSLFEEAVWYRPDSPKPLSLFAPE
jgi:hypothetical protein